jgi:hypothetical protein
MKKTSTLALVLSSAVAIVIALAPIPQAHAFGGAPGGPFSNGSYFPNDGTFSAVVRGENLTGTVQFSTTSGSGETGVGSTGVSSIYYNGVSYNGNSQGAYNPQASEMAVSFQAGAQGQGEQEFEVSTIVDLGDLYTKTTTINPDGSRVTEETVTPQREITPESTVTYFDSLYLNGSVNCKTSNAFPNQKISGNGEAQSKYLITNVGNTPILNKVNIPISVSGVRLSNTSSTFTISEVRPPSVNQVTILN